MPSAKTNQFVSIFHFGRIGMTMKLKPLGSRVVVEPREEEDVLASGLVLPETAKEKPQKGLVISVGPGDRDDEGKRVPMDVAEGDLVLFAKYSGTEIKIDGKKLLILRESDLLAIVDENKKSK
jgi:chaperonin GroES